MRLSSAFVLLGLCSAAAGFLALGGCAGEPGKLVIEPTSLEFGTVRHGEVRHATLRLRNPGNDDVSFQARATCGCLALGAGYRTLVAPGEYIDLQVRFDSAHIVPGKQDGSKGIEIKTNEAGSTAVLVPLIADIVRIVDVVGTRVRLEEIAPGHGRETPRFAEFRPSQGYTLRVERIQPLGADAAFLEFTPEAPAPDGAIQVEITVKPDATRATGSFEAGAEVHFVLTAPDGATSKLVERIVVVGTWTHTAPR